MSALSKLIDSNLQRGSEKLEELGIEVGKLYTDHGFPIDMALDRLELSHDQKLLVLDGACQWLIEHKRNSGATEKSIERQRKINRQMIERFINGQEVGAY